MTIYTTKSGDVLDAICHQFYGSTLEGQTEAILEANRALDLGQYLTLPAGLNLAMPELEKQTVQSVRLFS